MYEMELCASPVLCGRVKQRQKWIPTIVHSWMCSEWKSACLRRQVSRGKVIIQIMLEAILKNIFLFFGS